MQCLFLGWQKTLPAKPELEPGCASVYCTMIPLLASLFCSFFPRITRHSDTNVWGMIDERSHNYPEMETSTSWWLGKKKCVYYICLSVCCLSVYFVCAHMYTCARAGLHAPSFRHASPGDWTQVIRLGSSHLHRCTSHMSFLTVFIHKGRLLPGKHGSTRHTHSSDFQFSRYLWMRVLHPVFSFLDTSPLLLGCPAKDSVSSLVCILVCVLPNV